MIYTAFRYFLIFSVSLITVSVSAQTTETQIANEYFLKHDYEKAYDYYKKQIRKESERTFIYHNYIVCVRKLNEQEAAIKLLDKLINEEVTNIEYQVDKAIFFKEIGNNTEYEKLISNLVESNKNNRIQTLKLGTIFQLRKMNDKAIELYLNARNQLKSKTAYAEELAIVYKNIGKTNEMLIEWINLLEEDASKVEFIQNLVLTHLTTENAQNLFLDKLYEKVSSDKEKLQFNEMMVWMYMQRKDFYNAFIQLRSLDKKSLHYRGSSLIELADIAVKNKEYKIAIEVYAYVISTYPNEYFYEETQKKLIQTQEIEVRENYPVDTLSVKKVIEDYQKLLDRSRSIIVNADIKISQAELYAVYLHNTKTAQDLLKEVLENSRQTINKKAEAKLLLGDIYLLDGKTGEAMIEYMQVERMIEDDDLGHIAKLKTAKVSYYESEFELAQAHLDILKHATTRKIANDAQDLSLLIKNNYSLDTSAEAMSMYAQTELLIYQKKYTEALNLLEKIKTQFPNHSLSDELHFQRGQIFIQVNKYEQAVEELKLVIMDKDGILADDATNQLANLFDYKLKNKVEAKEYYKRILLDFPGSIYVAEARKRFYEL